MTDKLKKQIILNLPYLIFVYLFDKLCQGVRLSPGAAASEKLLHIGQGFSAAFASLAPSFHLVDLCVGAAGAVLIRLVVYSKGKNAKKYRRGIEYGSARWGTPADIAPYVDPDFSQNVLLTQTERITMSSRPKEPKYARNKNILVIGGSGSGKTRFFVKPKLSQEEHRTRNHRLIVRGAVFESIVPEAKTMTDEEAAAFLRLALTSEEARAYLKKRTEGGKSE